MLRSQIQRDLGRIERECRIEPRSDAQTFTWNGAEVPCIPTSISGGIAIDAEGNAITVDLKLLVRFENFLTADSTLVDVSSELFTADNQTRHPVAGRTLEFRGKELRIVTARVTNVLSYYELTLVDAASNQ